MQCGVMAQFYIRSYKVSGAWCVDVCTREGKRSRNESPSFFADRTSAIQYAKNYSAKTGIPLKQ